MCCLRLQSWCQHLPLLSKAPGWCIILMAWKFETYSTNPDAGEEANFEYFTSELNLDLNNANLTLLTDFRQHKRSYRVDGDFTPSDVESVFLNFTENAKEFSQEIRLTSTEDNMVNWVIGAYYYQQEIDLSTIVEFTHQLTISPTTSTDRQ